MPPCYLPAPTPALAIVQRTWAPPAQIIAVRNGIVDSHTLMLLPPSPALFAIGASPVEFKADAEAPQWDGFIREIFDEDQQMIDVLQEFFGYVLSDLTKFQKMLWILGPSRSGKGTVGRILRSLVGASNTAGSSFSTFVGRFGMQSMIGKKLVVFGDVRVPSHGDRNVILERLTSLTGEDIMELDKKTVGAWNGKPTARLVLLSNEMPNLPDSADPLRNRILLLRNTKSFENKEDRTLEDRLTSELQGILRWALVGLHRLLVRGKFTKVDAVAEEMRARGHMASPISGFLSDYCTIDPRGEVDTAELFRARKAWDNEQGNDKKLNQAQFGHELRAVVPGIRVVQRRGNNGSLHRLYVGLTLSLDGRAMLAAKDGFI